MSVYIEYVIIDNMVLTYVISDLSCCFIGCKRSAWRGLVCSLVGTAVAIFYPFVNDKFYLTILKLALLMALSVILFYKKAKLWLGMIVFLGITFVLGGLMFAINYTVLPYVGKETLADFSIGAIVLIAFACWVLVKKIALAIKKRADVVRGVISFEVKIGDFVKELKGFVDTGNRLYDYDTEMPIVIVKADKILSCFSEEQLLSIIAGKPLKTHKKAHYITYSTVAGGNNKMLVIQPDCFRIKEEKGFKEKAVMLGICFSPIKDCENYDAILHPSII